MSDTRTIYELKKEEFEELRLFMLFDEENEFFESIDEITDSEVVRRFGNMTFRREDFSCNMIPTPISSDIPAA
ncbi:MAG: hypothetical protein K6F83_01325 [Clostridiales bacterium]|nr:hypothetical protein [Clostridiales bacterium]